MGTIQGHVFSPKGLLRASGPDAPTFLQGQFSADLNLETPKACVYGLWLDRKGKVLADSYALREGEQSFLILSHHAAGPAIKERLEAYIIMDEVEVAMLQEEARAAQLWLGEQETGALARRLPEPGKWSMLPEGNVSAFWGVEGRGRALELLAVGAAAEERLRQAMGSLGREIDLMDTDALAAKRLRAGAFQWGSDILESDLPQEAGLERTAVSHDKGCYLGQEVMAGIKAMGRVRRRLRLVRLSAPPKAELPHPLVDEKGKGRGELRRFLEDKGEMIGSAMVAAGCDGPLRLEGEPDVVVEWSEEG